MTFGKVRKYPAQNPESIPDSDFAIKRPVIFRPIVGRLARERHKWHVVLHIYAHENSAFVVAQIDVIARHVAFDHFALEKQCIELALGRNPINVGDLGHQSACFDIGMLAIKVRPHAIFEHRRLADVNNLAISVFMEINAGRIRQGFQFGGKLLVHAIILPLSANRKHFLSIQIEVNLTSRGIVFRTHDTKYAVSGSLSRQPTVNH